MVLDYPRAAHAESVWSEEPVIAPMMGARKKKSKRRGGAFL